jgi:hypothetical protein
MNQSHRPPSCPMLRGIQPRDSSLDPQSSDRLDSSPIPSAVRAHWCPRQAQVESRTAGEQA